MINLIDKYTSYMHIYFLQNKSKSYNALIKLICDVTAISEVGEIHSDYAKEFKSNNWLDVTHKYKIKT